MILESPSFGYTQEIVKRLKEVGVEQEEYQPFSERLNAYFANMANHKNLLALGILAVPSNEGSASYIVDEGGVVLDALGYWSKPHKPKSTDDGAWMDLMGNQWKKVATAFFQSYSLADYPSLDAFELALQDPGIRRGLTETNVNCEFWGFVTTEQLRREMAASKD